jgi:hypothetical protein
MGKGNEIIYAKIGETKYLAGINLEKLAEDANIIKFNNEEFVFISEDQIPKEYDASINYLKTDKDWQKTTETFLLIKHFENYKNPFKKCFNDKAVR